MSEEDPIALAIREHGNSLGTNLVYLKRFLQAERRAQQEFLAEQRQASDRAQGKSERIAWLALGATAFAAIATGIQAYVAWRDQAPPARVECPPAASAKVGPPSAG